MRKKGCYAYQNSSTCVALLHKETVLSLETSSEINFEFIKFVKKEMSPFDKNEWGILYKYYVP